MDQVVFQPVVILVIDLDDLPLLAFARCCVDLLGHLCQPDLLEIVLCQEPAAADCCRFGFSLLFGNSLQLLRLAQAIRVSKWKCI